MRVEAGQAQWQSDCSFCNGHKWAASEAIDPKSGDSVPLFHPRADSWSEHFEWSATLPGQLVARSPVGRATIERLRINSPDMIALRNLLAEVGLFPEVPN